MRFLPSLPKIANLSGAAHIIVLGAVGDLGLYVSPFVMGALVEEFSAREGQISMIMALQFGAVGVSSIIVALLSARLDLRFVIYLSVVLMIIGNSVSFAADDLQVITAARALTGLGEGGLLSSAYALAARTADPDRTFAAMVFVSTVFAFVFLVSVPYVVSRMGASGTFGLILAFAVVLLPVITLLRQEDTESPTGRSELSLSDFALLKGRGLALFVGFALITMATESLWLFVERIGADIGLSLQTVSRYVLVALVAAAVSPALMFVIGNRLGRTRPIVIAVALAIVAAFIQTRTSHAALYGVSIFVVSAVLIFLVPFIRAAMSDYDASGQLAAASCAAFYLGSASGPALVGMLLLGAGDAGYRPVGWFAAACLMLALLALLPATIHLDSRARRPKTHLSADEPE